MHACQVSSSAALRQVKQQTRAAFENEWQAALHQIPNQRQSMDALFKNAGIAPAKLQPLIVYPL
jgi:NAD(P)-dependent dehydrogenase (short-subunit alcohol dehydrogenase family)